MALNWKSVSAQHVVQACAVVATAGSRAPSHGLVIWQDGQCLPAKEVLREAYRIANKLGATAEIRFSSGDATLNTLTKLGFKAERLKETTESELSLRASPNDLPIGDPPPKRI